MMTYRTAVEWTGHGSDFSDSQCSRVHAWRFDGEPPRSPTGSDHVVTIPSSNPVRITPKEAFVAALSSGLMLCFLERAARSGYIVEYYSDSAEGSLSRSSAASPRVAHVVLQPAVLFTGPKVPTDAAVAALHEAAHAAYSLTNSDRTVLETVGVWHHQRGKDGD